MLSILDMHSYAIAYTDPLLPHNTSCKYPEQPLNYMPTTQFSAGTTILIQVIRLLYKYITVYLYFGLIHMTRASTLLYLKHLQRCTILILYSKDSLR